MNWLVIAVIVLIVLATLAGAKRGLVKTVLSFASFFVSLVIMLFVREPVSDFVKDQTGIYAAIETSVSSFVEEKTQEIQAGQAQLTDKVIDSLNLPDVLTKSLEQSNSKAVYEQRGIQNIAAYITGWLTDLAFEAVCCIISFVVVWILLRIVTMLLAGIVRLPVLHQIDCIAGASEDSSRDSKEKVIRYLFTMVEDIHSAVMVGDTVFDIIGARETGVDAIGVTWGFGNVEEMKEKGARNIVSNCSELEDVILGVC